MEWIARALLVTIVASLITSSIGVAPVVAASPPAVSDPVSPASIPLEAPKVATSVTLPSARSASPVVVGSCAGTTYQEDDPNITNAGGWQSVFLDTSASGGSFKGDNGSLTATATLYFTGNCVSWIYVASNQSGVVSAYIDGALVESIDTYTSSGYFLYGQTRSYQLESGGNHTLMVRATSAHQATYVPPSYDMDCHCWSDGYWIYVGTHLYLDAFIAPGV